MHKIVMKSTFTLLNTDYVKLNKSWNYKKIISPFFRMYLIDAGSGSLSGPDQHILLEPGFLYLIPSFTICDYTGGDFLSQYYIQLIEESVDGSSLFLTNRKIFKTPATQLDEQLFKNLIALHPNRGLPKHDPKDYEKRPVLQEFMELNNLLTAGAHMETTGIILQLLSRFLSSCDFKATAQAAVPSKVLEAIHYIQTHLSESLSVADLALRAGQNPDYFSRIFLEHTGERPVNYIQFKRIEQAQFLIITSDFSFGDIAERTGFESLSYFNRIFKKMTGQTPGQYKANLRAV